jgi:mono/diheme cytochrome c family protein
LEQNVKATRYRALFALALGLAAPAGVTVAQEAAQVPFPREGLQQREYVETGKEAFGKTCKFCHGKAAYPGKAPKLNPSRYTTDSVYERVTHGFRGMPPFKETFSEKERQGVTAYVMSKEFAN